MIPTILDLYFILTKGDSTLQYQCTSRPGSLHLVLTTRVRPISTGTLLLMPRNTLYHTLRSEKIPSQYNVPNKGCLRSPTIRNLTSLHIETNQTFTHSLRGRSPTFHFLPRTTSTSGYIRGCLLHHHKYDTRDPSTTRKRTQTTYDPILHQSYCPSETCQLL